MGRRLPLAGGVGHVDGYRLWLQSQNRSHFTIDNYLRWIKVFQAWCREHEANYLKADREMLTYFLGNFAASHAPTTTSLMRSSLRSFFEYLKEEQKIPANPVDTLRWKKAQARPVEMISDDELRRMFIACKTFREQAIFLLFVGAGLRRNEVYQIKRDDVNFEQGTVTVLGKGSKYRTVCPGVLAMDALHNALAFDEELCPYKFITYPWCVIRELGKRAGIRGRIYPHRFRHSFATKALDAGMSPEELQEILGHANLSQTLFYAKAGRTQRALTKMREIDLPSRLLGPALS